MLLLDGSQHPLVLDSTILSADGRCSWDLVLGWLCVWPLLLVQPQHTSTITKPLPLVEPASPSFLSLGSFLLFRTHPCNPYIPQKSSQVSKNSQPFRDDMLKFPRRDARERNGCFPVNCRMCWICQYLCCTTSSPVCALAPNVVCYVLI